MNNHNFGDCSLIEVSGEEFCIKSEKIKILQWGEHVATFMFVPDGHPASRKPIRVSIRNDWELRSTMRSRKRTYGDISVFAGIKRGGQFTEVADGALEKMTARVNDPKNDGRILPVNDLFRRTGVFDDWSVFVVPSKGHIVRHVTIKPPNEYWSNIGSYYSNWLDNKFSVLFGYRDNTSKNTEEFISHMIEIDDEFRSILESSKVNQ